MLPPDYLARVMEGAEEVASRLHTDILNDVIKRIMIRLDRGDSYVLTATDKWQLETLIESGYLREDIEKEIAKRTGLQRKVVRDAFRDAGVRSLSYDDAIYQAAGISTAPLAQSPALVRVLQTMYERTMGEWENITRTTAEEAQRLFIQVCDNAYTQVMTGAKSRSQAVKEAVEEVAKDGVTVTYPTGHTDTIEVATARAVRTGITQSAAQITLERMKEFDVDLVLTSSHLGARPTHEPWQGKVFHVDFSVLTGRLRSANAQTQSGATHEYPDLVEATRYGYVDGLCGANCRHSMMPYIEGVTKNPFEQFDTEENKKQYDLEQKQREMERKIRKIKREVQGLQTAIDNADELTKPGLEAQHQKRAQRLTELNKEYKKFCEDNGLKTRQERLSIAGWTRQQASRASGAARANKIDGRLPNLLEGKIKIPEAGTRVPNAITAATPNDKVQRYLLNSNHPVGKNKERVINSVLGYHYENWELLSNQIYDKLQTSDISKIIDTEYGRKYVVPMRIDGLRGRSMVLETVWQIDNGGTIPRFITAKPEKRTARRDKGV